MSLDSTSIEHADRARWNIVELLVAIRLLGGAILASLAASAVLYAPDQVHEFYRITASDRDQAVITREIVLGLGSLTAMAAVFYWVGVQIVIQCGNKISADARFARGVLTVTPILIGALPLIASGFGMLAARPAATASKVSVASPWEGMAQRVTDELNNGLQQGAAVMFSLAAMLVAVGILFAWHGRRHGTIDDEAQRRATRFFSMLGLIASIGIVVAMTFATMYSPVWLPQTIGTLALLALFFIAIMLMTGQMSVWQETTGIPFVIVLGAFAIGFAALDLNDNHEIRALKADDKDKAAPPEQVARLPGRAWESFQAWYRARPDRAHYKDTYPVYIVAAQGGGIYAAYHTATLLSRIQDLCPRFSHHLFAISSVSGGSLGAGVYAAVTKGLARSGSPADHDDDAPDAAQPGSAPQAAASDASAARPAGGAACPALERMSTPTERGRHEAAAVKMLATDYLSPLAAGMLFPDFTQRFLPFAVPQFDRARWLEEAFEKSWKLSGIAGPNPLAESALRLWSADGHAPALLINTTESDSGRRLVISPFRMGELNAKGETLQFPLWNMWDPRGEAAAPRGIVPNPGHKCQGRDIPLSAAIGLSARFPWLTPAGSLTTDCNDQSKPVKTRLVDGGYSDNSGVDTAIDVITQLSTELAKTGFKLDGPSGPRIELHLIVLTTSDYPQRAGYGLGDGLEPIRALLSARTARTPIAINQAKRRLAILQKAVEAGGEGRIRKVYLPHIHEARFKDTIFRIPLGWRLSQPSREIIDIQSGRYWDCDADDAHQQRNQELSNADCIQLMVAYHLEDAIKERLNVVALGLSFENSGLRTEMPPFDMKQFVGCFAGEVARPGQDGRRGRTLQPRHIRSIEGILQAWSRGNRRRTNFDWLAYALALADHETGSLPVRFGGCLTEKCALRRLEPMASYSPTVRASLEPDARNNRYYERGYIQLAGAQRYKSMADLIHQPIDEHPDLMLVPLVSAQALIAWLTEPEINPTGTLDRFMRADASGAPRLDVEMALKTYMFGARAARPDFTINPRLARIWERARARVTATYGIAGTCIARVLEERKG